MKPPAADASPRQCALCSHSEEKHFSCEMGSFYKDCSTKNDIWEHVFRAVPPIPQEAAPRPINHNCTDVLPATAPDEAMRVAEKITESGYLRTADIAALIRQAGSDEITKLRVDRAREHQWLNLAATEANCDLDSVASAIRKLRQAGSERERELANALNDALYVMNSRPQQGWDKWRNAVAEASRLLGGESK